MRRKNQDQDAEYVAAARASAVIAAAESKVWTGWQRIKLAHCRQEFSCGNYAQAEREARALLRTVEAHMR